MYLYLWLKNWLESKEEGQGLVEYALIIALVSIVADRRARTPRGGHRRCLQQNHDLLDDHRCSTSELRSWF